MPHPPRQSSRRLGHALHRALRAVALPALAVAPLGLTAMLDDPGRGRPASPEGWASYSAASRLPAPPPARLWRDSRARWVHQHARTFDVYVPAGPDRALSAAIRHAVLEWNRRTILNLRLVRSPARANVVISMRRYGARRTTSWTYVCGPCRRTLVRFNLDRVARRPRYGRFPYTASGLRALACHEVGHVLGLQHGGGDCMSFGYHRTPVTTIGYASVRLLNRAYTGVPVSRFATGTTAASPPAAAPPPATAEPAPSGAPEPSAANPTRQKRQRDRRARRPCLANLC